MMIDNKKNVVGIGGGGKMSCVYREVDRSIPEVRERRPGDGA